MLKNKILLKKSYEARRLLDVLLNVDFIVFLHLNKYHGENYLRLKKDLEKLQLRSWLLNKDKILNELIFLGAKGPTLLVYNNSWFLDKLEEQLKKYNWNYEIILLKAHNFLNKKFSDGIIKRYGVSFSVKKVFPDFFSILNQYKLSLIFFKNQMYKLLVKMVTYHFYIKYIFFRVFNNKIKAF